MQNKMANEETHENINNTVNSKRNWALFTYAQRNIKIIIKLLEQQNINTAFKMKNTTGNILSTQSKPNTCHKSGINYSAKNAFVNI
jgi:hypothetical protein